MSRDSLDSFDDYERKDAEEFMRELQWRRNRVRVERGRRFHGYETSDYAPLTIDQLEELDRILRG